MFKVGDTVRVLPNKMIGKVTDISEGFVILDDNQARPYFPQQVKKIVERKEAKMITDEEIKEVIKEITSLLEDEWLGFNGWINQDIPIFLNKLNRYVEERKEEE